MSGITLSIYTFSITFQGVTLDVQSQHTGHHTIISHDTSPPPRPPLFLEKKISIHDTEGSI